MPLSSQQISAKLRLARVQITNAEAWHLNSDEPVSLDYNLVRRISCMCQSAGRRVSKGKRLELAAQSA
jgi:predicted extracellular nuclease